MAITRVGSQTASATSLTVPAHQAGDLILIWAERNASATAPTVPVGYIPILKKAQGTNVSAVLGYRIANATNDSSGTWTNAAELECHVYRPSSGNTLRIGQSASNSSTTTTVNYPAITLADSTSGNSWVVGFAAANNITQTLSTAPTGMTNVTSLAGGVGQVAGHDTNAGVSSWTSQNVTAGVGNSVSAVVEIVLAPTSGSLTSNIYQHIAGGGKASNGEAGNTYKCPLDLTSGAGNTIIFAFTTDNAATVSSVNGAVNGSFGSAAIHVNGGVGNLDTYVYVLPNIAAGLETITVTFGATTAAFQYIITEVYGVATTFSPSAGSTVQSTAFSTTIAAGSFTPPNNNATGGNFLWAYACKATSSNTQNTSGLFPSANFALLNADIFWSCGNATNAGDTSVTIPKAVEGFVQATSAAINPGFTSVAESADAWNIAAVALKISSGTGTAQPAGMQVIGIQHFTSQAILGTANTSALQCPAVGTLRLMTTSGADSTIVSGVRDSEGNSWSTNAGLVGVWFLASASPNPNLEVYVDFSGTTQAPNESWRYMDVVGASSSPYDTSIVVGDTLNGVTVFTPANQPNPTNSNGMVIACIGLGHGPGLAVTAPTGAIFDLCTYTGETDGSTIENADILAHYHNTASGLESWTFSITNQASNSATNGFVAFKAAPAGGAFVGDPPFIQYALPSLLAQ